MEKVDIEPIKVDFKKNTKLLKKILPKKEEIAVQYFNKETDFPCFVITFFAMENKYSLFEITNDKAILLGTSINPINLETKFLCVKEGNYCKIKK